MKRLVLTVLALALSLPAAHAQDASDVKAGQQQTAAMATGGSTGQGFQTLLSPFSFNMNSDEQTISLTGKFDLSKTDPDHNLLTVTAQAPLAQASDFTNLSSLDGLVKATTIEVRLALLGGGPQWAEGIKTEGQKEPLASWTATLDAKVGTQDHDYFDPTTLIQHTAHTTPWQVGGSAGYLFAGGHTAFNLSFNYQQFSQDGDTGAARTQCLTPDNCVTGFIGAPVRMDQALLTGDMRWIDKIGNYPLGAELNVTYDPIHDTEAVQVPIYLSTNDDGALSGGVRFGWNSTDHVAKFGVFVASTGFGLFQ